MKRYNISTYLKGGAPELELIEDPNGEWVKWKDIKELNKDKYYQCPYNKDIKCNMDDPCKDCKTWEEAMGR